MINYALNGNRITAEFVDSMRNLKEQWISFFKTELFLELFYQVALQIIILFLTETDTGTASLPGLRAIIGNSSFFFIRDINPTVFLTLSILWSMKSCISLQIQTIAIKKGYCQFKTKVILACYALFSTFRRILSIVIFFAPSLGLFSILHHWQEEQIPFKIRMKYPEKTKPTDKIVLYNVTDTIYWGDYDRTNYLDPKNPVPPEYSIYTGLSLSQTFQAFIILAAIHFIALLTVKVFKATDFKINRQKFSKFTFLIEQLNATSVYKDWDECEDTLENRKKRYENCKWEMIWGFSISHRVSFVHLVPLWITAYNIHKRHILLSTYFVEKENEIHSYNNVILLFALSTGGMICFCVLEVVFYFLYSCKFHPWIKIVKGTKIPKKDHDEELLNINMFAPQCKNINIYLVASNPRQGNVIVNLNVHAANDVNQGDSPYGSSDEKSYVN